MIDKNSLLLLNDIIYKIYSIENFEEMRKAVLKSLQILIPYTCSSFYLTSKGSDDRLIHPIGIGLTTQQLETYINEYEDLDYTRWIFACPHSKAYRETDLMDDSARTSTAFYKEMYAPSSIHFASLLSIVHNGIFLGIITLYRKKGELDFSDDEMLMLDILKDHLGFRLYGSYLEYNTKKSLPKLEDLIEKYHLTIRESEVIKLLLGGISNNDICEKLCISHNTLKKHTLNIYKKLEINSWRELLKLC